MNAMLPSVINVCENVCECIETILAYVISDGAN